MFPVDFSEYKNIFLFFRETFGVLEIIWLLFPVLIKAKELSSKLIADKSLFTVWLSPVIRTPFASSVPIVNFPCKFKFPPRE